MLNCLRSDLHHAATSTGARIPHGCEDICSQMFDAATNAFRYLDYHADTDSERTGAVIDVSSVARGAFTRKGLRKWREPHELCGFDDCITDPKDLREHIATIRSSPIMSEAQIAKKPERRRKRQDRDVLGQHFTILQSVLSNILFDRSFAPFKHSLLTIGNMVHKFNTIMDGNIVAVQNAQERKVPAAFAPIEPVTLGAGNLPPGPLSYGPAVQVLSSRLAALACFEPLCASDVTIVLWSCCAAQNSCQLQCDA